MVTYAETTIFSGNWWRDGGEIEEIEESEGEERLIRIL